MHRKSWDCNPELRTILYSAKIPASLKTAWNQQKSCGMCIASVVELKLIRI
jgi:hypothetical protein